MAAGRLLKDAGQLGTTLQSELAQTIELPHGNDVSPSAHDSGYLVRIAPLSGGLAQEYAVVEPIRTRTVASPVLSPRVHVKSSPAPGTLRARAAW